ncbi:MAG: T9SS type A sorting domain-containing protein, partial [Gemmatimonadetes bacterium]|nr:T9SS type A sorting domain-containing protein [Gemmatimonadota bacterium]
NDGDLDLFLANNDEPAVLLRNDNLTDNWLQVDLMGHSPNTEEIGARVKVTIGASTQMREIRCGSNFQSQDPSLPHFGLGTAATVDEVRVEWTNGEVTTLTNVTANQRLTVFKPAVDAPVVGPKAVGELTLLGASPNPFRSGAAIRFALSRSTETTIRVFDSAGRTVRTLADGARPAGEQAVAWDGRDASGRAVASGIYYYEVRTADRSERGKLVRLR